MIDPAGSGPPPTPMAPTLLRRCAIWTSLNGRELIWAVAALGGVMLLSTLFPGAGGGL